MPLRSPHDRGNAKASRRWWRGMTTSPYPLPPGDRYDDDFGPTALPAGLLYHYTDGAGLLGILARRQNCEPERPVDVSQDQVGETLEVRATDAYYLNDANEVVGALLRAAEYLDDAAPRLSTAPPPRHPNFGDLPCARDRGKSLAGTLRAYAEMKDPRGWRARPTYVFSVSAEPDSLSQWRAYTRPGNAYALGFAPELLPDLRECRYSGAANGPDDLTRFMDKVIADLNANLDVNTDQLQPKPFGVALHRMMSLYKDRAFLSEQEWRIVHRPKVMWPPEDIEEDFRIGSFSLRPFAPVKIPADALKEVWIGPGPHLNLAKAAVNRFLAKRSALTSIQVRQTGVPYRTV
jgi:hypothetical protein